VRNEANLRQRANVPAGEGGNSGDAHVPIFALNLGWATSWYWNTEFTLNDSFSMTGDYYDNDETKDRE
jgi:hypothetical protein